MRSDRLRLGQRFKTLAELENMILPALLEEETSRTYDNEGEVVIEGLNYAGQSVMIVLMYEADPYGGYTFEHAAVACDEWEGEKVLILGR